jgi:hypothetical protein
MIEAREEDTMTMDGFREIFTKKRFEKPKILALSTPDALATTEQIAKVENILNISLPILYRQFLMEFGGGSFGLITVFSASEKSEYYLPFKMSEIRRVVGNNLLIFSDDYAGGYYGFHLHEGRAAERVMYWDHETQECVDTDFADILEFVARYAFDSA